MRPRAKMCIFLKKVKFSIQMNRSQPIFMVETSKLVPITVPYYVLKSTHFVDFRFSSSILRNRQSKSTIYEKSEICETFLTPIPFFQNWEWKSKIHKMRSLRNITRAVVGNGVTPRQCFTWMRKLLLEIYHLIIDLTYAVHQ